MLVQIFHHVTCGISDFNCVITVDAQLFLASGLCVYKCVCIVIHFGSVRSFGTICVRQFCGRAACQLLCVGPRYLVTLNSAVHASACC